MERLISVFDKIAFFSLSSMVFIVVASVLGRLIFDLTGGTLSLVLPGSIELVSYALAIMVFSSFPRAVMGGMVKVDLLVRVLPVPVQRFLDRLWDLVLASFAAIVGFLFFHKMLTMFKRGDVSQDLEIPLYLVYGVLTICCICIVLTAVWLAIKGERDLTPNK
ncbi:TRAP transporter small permease [Saccharospirillum sp.]|uniref:TRAP transporter small permease n=1 Tax=Saccharospirillum sp. TaxID=2033801 RepID=UPI0034A096E9